QGFSEPNSGSDLASLRTRAVREGDEWVINGSKMFITNGVHANLYFVAAKTGPGKREVSMFIVEKGTPGFSVGRALKKTGWLSSDTAELVFDNVRIPAGNLLGEPVPHLGQGPDRGWLADSPRSERATGGEPLTVLR
ncbi:hypothetical protein EO238_24250, partial [Citrobacter sp. AAK_AS5]